MMKRLAFALLILASVARADQPVVSFEDTGATAQDLLQYDGTNVSLKSIPEILSNATTDIDQHDLGDVSEWTDYTGTTSFGSGGGFGTCTITKTIEFVWAKNHGGWCHFTYAISSIGLGASACSVDYFTLTAPWDDARSVSGERLCGSAYYRNISTATEYPADSYTNYQTNTIRLYNHDRSSFSNSHTHAFWGHCLYRCDAP